MASRKIRAEQDARKCLAAVKAAGISRRIWAQQHGIDGRSLYAWARNLERSDSARGARKKGHRQKQQGMVELISGASQAGGRIVIRSGPFAVEIDEHFDDAILTRVLRVIAAC